MPSLSLPAFAGHLPYGWLPALGLLRVLAPAWTGMTVRWDARWACPVLDGGPASIDEVVDAVLAVLAGMPEGAVLPGVDAGHPAPDARHGSGLLAPWTGPDAADWQRALVSPTGDLHPLIRPHAAQTMGRTLSKMVAALRADPTLVRAAITGLGMTEIYGAGLWMLRSIEPKPSASPGRDWLAVMATPWMPVVESTPPGGVPVTAAVGWPLDGAGRPTLSWSLWTGHVPVTDIPDLLAAMDADPSPRYRWSRRRATRHDPPMLVPVPGSPLTRGHPGHADLDPGPDGTERLEVRVPTRVLADIDRMIDGTVTVPGSDPDGVGPETREEMIAAMLSWAVLETLARPARTGGDAMGRLAAYRQAREGLHDDVRAAVAGGASQVDVARASGLTRQWVAKILAQAD